MTRSDFLKIANIVFDIGESADHFMDMDYDTRWGEIQLYVFNKTEDGNSDGIADSVTVNELDEEAQAFFTRWTERIRKERVLNGTH